jgi:hypothetical protein
LKLVLTGLDIFFPDKPKVTVTRQASDILEEGKGSITMTCTADANPPARISWRKYDGTDESKFTDFLELNPVRLWGSLFGHFSVRYGNWAKH